MKKKKIETQSMLNRIPKDLLVAFRKSCKSEKKTMNAVVTGLLKSYLKSKSILMPYTRLDEQLNELMDQIKAISKLTGKPVEMLICDSLRKLVEQYQEKLRD